MTHSAKIPLKMKGEDIGHAWLNADGSITLVLGYGSEVGKELLHHVEIGLVFGLTISPIINPAVDGRLIARVDHERPLPEYGGIQIDDGGANTA